MTVRDQFDLPAVRDAAVIYGKPHVTEDGTTVITVTAPGGRFRRPRPLGAFLVADGRATFVPVIDATRTAVLGEMIGLVAAALVAGAVLRRPPWPDLSATARSRRTGMDRASLGSCCTSFASRD